MILCETDGECPEHGRFIYYCYQCQQRWERENPLTVAAIHQFAGGKGSRALVDAARKRDRANRNRQRAADLLNPRSDE